MTRRAPTSPALIRHLVLATLLSLGLHVVFVGMVSRLQHSDPRGGIAPPRMQLTLRQSLPPPAPVPALLPRAADKRPERLSTTKLLGPTSNPKRARVTVTPTPQADAEPVPLPRPALAQAEVAAPPRPITGLAPSSSALPNAGRPIVIDIDRSAPQDPSRGNQKSLAARAQEQLSGSGARVSAFEKSFSQQLATAQQNGPIVSETAMADGSRLVKFSGGTCMRIPNPAIASPAKPAQAMVISCD